MKVQGMTTDDPLTAQIWGRVFTLHPRPETPVIQSASVTRMLQILSVFIVLHHSAFLTQSVNRLLIVGETA